MAETPSTFSESWYRVAPLRLALRPDVRTRRQNYRGHRWIVLDNPIRNQFFRLRPAAYDFVARLRPDRTVEEAWKECLEENPDEAPGQEAAIQLLAQLYLAGLLQYRDAGDAAKLFERFEKTRQREARATWLNVMFMRFPLLDPDAVLVRTLPWVRPFLGGFGALLWLALVGWAGKIVLDHWSILLTQSQGVLDPSNLIWLYGALVFVKVFHEFGHAYACRHFGGEVHVMGVMLMIFTPMPYVDATASWAFRSRWHRAFVGAAGMIVELFIAALAAIVWVNTGQGLIHSLAYNVMFVASVSTLLFNLNPLLRFDGYYILSDLLEIPNLHQRSTAQLRYWSERGLFGVTRGRNPATSTSEAIWLTVFGVASGIYRVFVFAGILLFVADQFLIFGLLMAAACAIAWVVRPTILFLRYLASSPQLDRHRFRAVTVSGALALGLFVLLNYLPFPHHFRAPGVVESQRWSEIVNATAGQLAEVLTPTGAKVAPGQALLRLESPELELSFAAVEASILEVEARLREALQNQTPDLKPLSSRLDSLEKRKARLAQERSDLVIRAPHAGVWAAPQVLDWIGRWLTRGTACGLLLDGTSTEFVATVRQEDGDRLFNQKISGAEVRLSGDAEVELATGPSRIIPAERRQLPSPALGWAAGGEMPITPSDTQGTQASEPFFEVRVPLTESGGVPLLHGRSGKIRFDLPKEPLLPRWIRRLRQLLQKRYQL